MEKEVKILVEKLPKKNFYSCFMNDEMPYFGLAGSGRTVRDAIAELYESQEEIRKLLEEMGKTMPKLKYRFIFDIGSFFNYYDYLDISALAHKVGISPSLMRSYATGESQPRSPRKEQIEDCLHNIGKELQAIELK